MRPATRFGVALLLALASGCSATPSSTAPAEAPHAHAASAHGHGHHAAPAKDSVDARLEEVARIHGGAGPWAVAGYRMGEGALAKLGVERGSFDLTIEHFSPKEVQYSCIADGAAASTGASLGKLNLSLAEAPREETRTIYRRKSTGQSVTLRVTKAFAARFADVPRPRLGDAGREAMQLRDDEIFEVVP